MKKLKLELYSNEPLKAAKRLFAPGVVNLLDPCMRRINEVNTDLCLPVRKKACDCNEYCDKCRRNCGTWGEDRILKSMGVKKPEKLNIENREALLNMRGREHWLRCRLIMMLLTSES